MARTDLVGLLTGIGSSPIDPTIAMTPRQAALQRGAQYGQGFRRSVGALTGADTRTTGEVLQKKLSGLNPESVQDQQQIIELVSQVDPARAMALQTQFNVENRARQEADRAFSLQERQVTAAEAAAGGTGIGKLNPQTYTPESLQAFAENLEKTGNRDYSLLKEIDLVKKTFQVKMTEDIVNQIGKRSEQLASSAQRQSSLNQMSRLLDTGLKTGSLAELSKSFKGVLSDVLGVELEGLAEAEALTAIANKLALEVRNPASGMGLPGATSNRDLDFLNNAIPGLRKSVKGNRLMIALAKEQHKMRQALNREQARIIKEHGGYAPLDLESRLQDFYTSYSIDPSLAKEAEELLASKETEKSWAESDLEARLEAFKNSQPKPRKRGPQ